MADYKDMFFVVTSEPAAPYIILRLTAASLRMSALFCRARGSSLEIGPELRQNPFSPYHSARRG
jgi:hypothetical protein